MAGENNFISIDASKCIGCGQCKKDCACFNISMENGKAVFHDELFCMQCGHCIAVCPAHAVSSLTLDNSESIEYDADSSTVDPKNLLNFIKFRRATRWYDDKPVEREKLDMLLEAGRFTPTGSNKQSTGYIVVKGQKLMEFKELVMHTLSDYAKMLKSEHWDELDSTVQRYVGNWIDMYEAFKADPAARERMFFNAPAVIMIESDSQIDASLAACSIEFMANALGLGALHNGFATRAAAASPRIEEFLGIEKPKRLMACVVVGYPLVKYRRTTPHMPLQARYME